MNHFIYQVFFLAVERNSEFTPLKKSWLIDRKQRGLLSPGPHVISNLHFAIDSLFK